MPYVLVRHKVKDPDKWKTLFEQGGSARQAGGARDSWLFHNVNDPNDLLILFQWDNLEHANQFIQSEDLPQWLQQAGVTDLLDVAFLEGGEHAPA